MDLARIDDHDVAGRAVVGRTATRESLHAMERHADGVCVVRVAVIRERVERRFQQLDALAPVGPAHTLAASHPTDHNKASGCQIFLAARCGRPAELATARQSLLQAARRAALNSDRAKPEHGWRCYDRMVARHTAQGLIAVRPVSGGSMPGSMSCRRYRCDDHIPRLMCFFHTSVIIGYGSTMVLVLCISSR